MGGMGGGSRSMGGSMGGGSRSMGGNMGGSYRSYNGPHTVIRPSLGFGAPMGFYSPAPVYVAGDGGGGGSIFTILILGIFAFVAYQAITGGFGGYAPTLSSSTLLCLQ